MYYIYGLTNYQIDWLYLWFKTFEIGIIPEPDEHYNDVLFLRKAYSLKHGEVPYINETVYN